MTVYVVIGLLAHCRSKVVRGWGCNAKPFGPKATRAKREPDLAPTNDAILYPLGTHELYHLSLLEQCREGVRSFLL